MSFESSIKFASIKAGMDIRIIDNKIMSEKYTYARIEDETVLRPDCSLDPLDMRDIYAMDFKDNTLIIKTTYEWDIKYQPINGGFGNAPEEKAEIVPEPEYKIVEKKKNDLGQRYDDWDAEPYLRM